MFLPKKVLRGLAISAASLLITFVVAELVARANERGPFSVLDSNPYRHHPDNERIHRHAPNFEGRWDGTWYATDEHGFRGPDLGLTFDEQEFRVVCVGDSCTFGKGVLEQETWPRSLEALLQEEADGAWRPAVANLGVNGYSGKTYELIFRELGVPLKPDLVVIGYNLNDFPNVARATDEAVFGDRPLRAALPTKLRDELNRFAIYRWMRAVYYDMNRDADWKSAEGFASGEAEHDLESDVWREQRGFLEAIRDQAAASGAPLIVFLFPYESQVYLDSYDSTPIDLMRELCTELELPFVDLAGVFRARARETDPPTQLFIKGDRYHPNPLGYSIVAREVLRAAREANALPEP